MFEDNEKEVIETEEANEVSKLEESSNETTNNEGKKDYHIIKENFNKAICWAVIGLAIITFFSIFLTIINHTVDNEKVRLVINLICDMAQCGGLTLVGVIELKLFLNKTSPSKEKDIASFVISLVAFILAFLAALGQLYNVIWDIKHLIDQFKE